MLLEVKSLCEGRYFMGRNRFNQYNFMEIEREKEKFKQRKKQTKTR